MRLLLADDERQRYSAWYRDYGTLQGIQPDQVTDSMAPQAQALQQAPLTRSQQLIGLSNSNSQYNSLAPIVDLQIALITALPTVAKPMQVRLTKRNQCSDLRGYLSQGSLGSSPMSPLSSSSMLSYAPSATAASSASSIVMFPGGSGVRTLVSIVILSLVFYMQGTFVRMRVSLKLSPI